MQIDPRLAEIDNALYRIAARVLVVKGNKVLLVREEFSRLRMGPMADDVLEELRKMLTEKV